MLFDAFEKIPVIFGFPLSKGLDIQFESYFLNSLEAVSDSRPKSVFQSPSRLRSKTFWTLSDPVFSPNLNRIYMKEWQVIRLQFYQSNMHHKTLTGLAK